MIIKYERSSFFDFEMEILSSGVIKSVFPMSFIIEKDLIKAECKEYGKRVDFHKLTAKEKLDIIEKLTGIYMEIEKYPLQPEKLKFEPDKIFECEETVSYGSYAKLIKIPYIIDNEEKSIAVRLAALLEEKDCVIDIENEKINRLKEYMKTRNPDALNIANMICQLKRECINTSWNHRFRQFK